MWAAKGLDGTAAVFKGESAATNMVECPVQMIRNALLHAVDVPPGEAEGKGYSTCWPDLNKKWCICKHDVVSAHGDFNSDQFERHIEIPSQQVNVALTDAVMNSIRSSNIQRRDKSLVALSITAGHYLMKSGVECQAAGK